MKKVSLVFDITSVVCILIMLVSVVANIGWIRIVMFWLGIPIIHATVLFMLNHFASKCPGTALRVLSVLSYVTFLGFHCLFPDAGDTGTNFWGRSYDGSLSVLFNIGTVCAALNVAVFIVMLVLIIINKSQKADKKPVEYVDNNNC